MTEPTCCRSPERGLVRVSGRDARAFLHAQTTQRIDDLPPDETRLAAWLSPKGRVRALFDVVVDGDAFWLILPAELCATVVRDLGRFVLRADVELETVTDRAVYSLLGASDHWLGQHGLRLPAHGVARLDTALFVRTGAERVDVIGAADAPPAPLAGLAAAAPDAAALAAIVEGRPEISAAQGEHYVPQMLNLDELHGVSFTKGCYPGQEIVARIQNRGAVKRRLRRFATGPGERPAPGDGICDAEARAVGEINRVAATGDGYELLAVVELDAETRPLTLAADARKLTPKAPQPAGTTGS
jgi:folate-binding protein YgfZ